MIKFDAATNNFTVGLKDMDDIYRELAQFAFWAVRFKLQLEDDLAEDETFRACLHKVRTEFANIEQNMMDRPSLSLYQIRLHKDMKLISAAVKQGWRPMGPERQ